MALREAIDTGLAAVKHNWRPFVLIQGTAIAIVACYYMSPAVQDGLVSVATFKANGGYLFSGLATAFAGAILPEVAKRITTRGLKWASLGEWVFQLLFFASMGILVDFQYRFLGVIFGQHVDFQTVLKKILCDQFISTPLISIPYSAIAFMWKDEGFRFGPTAARVKNGEFAARYLPVLISAWSFWIPVVAAVYSMPGNLQFPLFLCAQAAWSLLLLHMSGR